MSATRARAGVSARVTGAGLVTRTVSIDETLGPAALGPGVTPEAGRTGAAAASGAGGRGQGAGTTGVRLTRV